MWPRQPGLMYPPARLTLLRRPPSFVVLPPGAFRPTVRHVSALRYLIDTAEAYATSATSSICRPVTISTPEETLRCFVLSGTRGIGISPPSRNDICRYVHRSEGAKGSIRVRECGYSGGVGVLSVGRCRRSRAAVFQEIDRDGAFRLLERTKNGGAPGRAPFWEDGSEEERIRGSAWWSRSPRWRPPWGRAPAPR